MSCMKKAVLPEAVVEILDPDTLISEASVIKVLYQTLHLKLLFIVIVIQRCITKILFSFIVSTVTGFNVEKRFNLQKCCSRKETQ